MRRRLPEPPSKRLQVRLGVPYWALFLPLLVVGGIAAVSRLPLVLSLERLAVLHQANRTSDQ